MIPIQGYKGVRVAVLGLGRSGMATCAALDAGGAIPLAWDESPDTRATAEAKGISLHDLSRVDWSGVAALIVSPGIPHLYPAPNRIIASAITAGVPVDNDIGLFFRSFATVQTMEFDQPPKVVAITGSNGKSTTTALLHHWNRQDAPRRWQAISAKGSCPSTRHRTERWWFWNCPATRPIWPAP